MLLRIYRALMPREDRFIGEFRRHTAVVAKAAVEFRALMEPGANVASIHEAICKWEHDADKITQDTSQAIRRTFLTPFDRDEILKLVSATDDIVDTMKSASRRFMRYGNDFTPQMCAMADCIVESTRILDGAIPMLGDITGNAQALNTACREVGNLESKADDLYRQGQEALFPYGTKPAAITAEQLVAEQVYDLIEEVADRCEDLADVIDSVVIEQV